MKTKRVLTVLLFACMVTGAAYAQARTQTPAQTQPAQPAAQPQKESKNTLSVDFFPLMKGFILTDNDKDLSCFYVALGFDHLIAPSHIIGGNLDLYYANYNKIDLVYFGLSFAYKYFTMSEKAEKAFIGGSVGFNTFSVDGKTKTEEGGFVGLTVGLIGGYRIIVKNIFLEPSLSYILAKTPAFGGGGTPLGWQGGFKLGFSL